MRSIAEINDKIRTGKAVVWTVAELKARVGDRTGRESLASIAAQVDVITTGTFEPMEGSGATLNLGPTDPPIKIRRSWLDGVPTYAGGGAVDLYIGAGQSVELSVELGDLEPAEESHRGGGHVIADLVAGKPVSLRAIGQITDCYPRPSLETTISRDSINQFILYNPRNLYQNFIIGVNGGDRPLYTYLGPLQPRLGNAVYACPGAISPLLNDPELRLIGVGTRVWLGGGQGYVVGEGTQHFPLQKRLDNQTPIGPAATLSLVGDAKTMKPEWVRGCYFRGYGPSLMLGVGVALPVLDVEVVARCAVRDEEIVAPAIDFSIPRRVRPIFGLFNYAQLKSGKIEIDGQTVRTAPLASLYLAHQVAIALQQEILAGDFFLTEPVAAISRDRTFLSQDGWGGAIELQDT